MVSYIVHSMTLVLGILLYYSCQASVSCSNDSIYGKSLKLDQKNESFTLQKSSSAEPSVAIKGKLSGISTSDNYSSVNTQNSPIFFSKKENIDKAQTSPSTPGINLQKVNYPKLVTISPHILPMVPGGWETIR